jgi:hypothetical protein
VVHGRQVYQQVRHRPDRPELLECLIPCTNKLKFVSFHCLCQFNYVSVSRQNKPGCKHAYSSL